MLLVTSRHHNGWVVPGGGIETGEEAKDAAIRELQEEVYIIYKSGFCLSLLLQAGVLGTAIELLGVFHVSYIC